MASFPAEEFSIYLNYVRKLGFEETPDYEFLKELFVKVLRSAGDVDDTMYDWKLLNSGRGWEANAVSLPISFALSIISSYPFECP